VGEFNINWNENYENFTLLQTITKFSDGFQKRHSSNSQFHRVLSKKVIHREKYTFTPGVLQTIFAFMAPNLKKWHLHFNGLMEGGGCDV
jgi:hypothetical protein